jgi:cell division protein FtsQ
MDIRHEVMAELAAAFGVDAESSPTDLSEQDLPEQDLPEVDLLEPELDPTAPIATVITISDEEFADPVYLDELGRDRSVSGPTVDFSGSTGRVVIVDGGEVDALVPGASGRDGPGQMEPRLRARRISVRRAEGRRRLRWVGIGGGFLLGLVVVFAILGSPLFSIAGDDVVVTGAVYTDQARLAEIIDDAVGSTTLLLDIGGIERRIEEIPWVDSARARTSFPTGLRIEIRERLPLATYQGADGVFRVIDKEGRVLDAIEGQPIAYMLLFGLEELTLEPGQFTPPGPVGAAQLVQALTATVRGRTQAIEVDPNGDDLKMYLYRDAIYATVDPTRELNQEDPEFDPIAAERIEIRFGAASELLLKLVRLETVLPVALGGEVSFIDVSTAIVTVR